MMLPVARALSSQISQPTKHICTCMHTLTWCTNTHALNATHTHSQVEKRDVEEDLNSKLTDHLDKIESLTQVMNGTWEGFTIL